MKKIFSVLLITTIITTLGSPVYASSQNPSDLQECIENSMFYDNEYRLFNEFTYQGMEINLFPETTITKEEALIKYKEAYNYIAEKASVLGIVADLDNYEFQQYIKGYAIPTSTNKELNDKLAEFAEFIDIYENAESNKKIISCLKEKEFNSEELELLLPISKSSTELSNKIAPSDNRESNGYSSNKATQYAKQWWNRTNNTDFPYYANYYKQDLNSNDYNDLDENAEGQSAIRRGWSDCTNFVSQCLSYGGFQYRKSGLILPHRQSKNWYYDNGKPSHTWGGANNFYQHWESRAGIAKTSDLLTAGDVISVDFTKDARDIIKSLEHTNGFTKSTRSAGRKIHKGYKSGPAFKAEYKEYKKVKGIRPDYYNPKTKTIYELKPYNPRSAKAGVKQLKKYKKKIGKRSNVRLEFY